MFDTIVLIAERDAALSRIAELEAALASHQWRPISEWDAMEVKPEQCMFGFWGLGRWMIHTQYYCSGAPFTHYLQLPPCPGVTPATAAEAETEVG